MMFVKQIYIYSKISSKVSNDHNHVSRRLHHETSRTEALAWAEEPHTTRSVEHEIEIRYSIDEWQYAFDLKLNPCRKTNNSSPSSWQSSQKYTF